MADSRLVRIGNSIGMVVPKNTLRELGWWQADTIRYEVQDGRLIIENVTQKRVKPVHITREYGDEISGKP